MKQRTIWGAALGFGGLVAIFATHDLSPVFQTFALAGWGLIWILPWRAVSIVVDAAGWQGLFRPGERPHLLPLARARWIAEAVNHLLPVMQVGGDLVRARLAYKAALQRGIPVQGVTIAATLVVDVTVALTAQIMFILLGFGQLWHRGILTVGETALACLLTLVPLGVLLTAQHHAVLTNAAGLLPKAGIRRFLQSIGAAGLELADQLKRLHQRRSAIALDIFWHLIATAFRIGETWCALELFGHPVSLGDATLINIMTGVARGIAFLIPGGLGVQEGGILLICHLVGVEPHYALALALIKRGRDLVFGLPARATWLAVERDILCPKAERAPSV
ncbi:MAG: lysylphosphatidylglycerol synthase domain-containing protein [Dongiaceae bacterium]